ncbi:MAG: hypothetical protein J2P41_15650, partial [Blastocatellia bacterium]|nr:hypothetical protein [Blastocatellia bacterium]
MTRVLLLNNVPSPNLKPLFDLLGRKSGWDLTVCYVCAWHRNVGWTPEKIEDRGPHRTIILEQKMTRLAGILGARPAAALALAHILMREQPDYLICYGYTLMPQITAILWSIFTNTPFAISGDSNIYCDSARPLSRSKRYIKRWWLRRIVRCASALLTVGTANRMFWEAYGARPERLFDVRFAVDNDFYARSAAARKAESMAMREKLGWTGKVVFL